MANIVIAGANRGIGLALTELYAGLGDHVFALCRNPDRADKLNELAKSQAGLITVGQVDFADGASIDRAANSIGSVPVDLLLNVGGIIRLESGPEDRNFDNWRDSFEVMVIGPFHMTQALLGNLERAKGKVLTVSSQVGASTWDIGGYYSYAAAKAAVNRAMKSLSVDLKPRGIAVGVVHPGYVLTDMGGPDAEITPQESAQGICGVAGRLNLENTGSFWKWNGEPHPW
jgi:NAD(P)-dependent dehydrogenase (short-subunit alcohol dehydrogenase family)